MAKRRLYLTIDLPVEDDATLERYDYHCGSYNREAAELLKLQIQDAIACNDAVGHIKGLLTDEVKVTIR